jgi:FMN phosphatase YigB (HAD superfamily)
LISQNIKEIKKNFNKDFADFVYDEFKKDYLWQKYPNCDLLLKNLKSLGYNIGIISNFDERLENILKNLNIIEYFSFILIPSKCRGLSKPNIKYI